MKEKDLYNKYLNKEHWKNRSDDYALVFSKFLKSEGFEGKIVDLGCGNGRDVELFRKEGFEVVGLDSSEKDILESREKYPKCSFDVKNIEGLDFEDNSISAFFIINVMHYVDKEKVFKLMYDKLKDSGYIFVHFNMLIGDFEGNVDYKHKKEDILNMISKFKIIYEREFERIDLEPIKHKHEVIEFILKK